MYNMVSLILFIQTHMMRVSKMINNNYYVNNQVFEFKNILSRHFKDISNLKDKVFFNPVIFWGYESCIHYKGKTFYKIKHTVY